MTGSNNVFQLLFGIYGYAGRVSKKKIFTATSYQGGQRGPNKDIYKLIKTICKHSKLTKSRLSALKPDGPNALNFQTTTMGLL